MKKFVMIFIVLLLVCCCNVFAATVADSFRYPVGEEDGEGWLNNTGGYEWLQNIPYEGDCGSVFHPGYDFNQDNTSYDQDRYEPVYAVANGEVIASYYETKAWGNIILIKHILPNGEVVFSFYGHLEERYFDEGDEVNKGDKIGTVGKGIGYYAHLHFEIRKSNMSDLNIYPAKYFPCGKDENFVKDHYYNPQEFIQSYHQVALTQSNTFNQQIYTAYTRAGGYSRLGAPFDNGSTEYVHDWIGITIQDFQHPDCPNGQCPDPAPRIKRHYGDDGQSAIIYNPTQNSAHLVRDGFWGVYKINNGVELLGPPEDEEGIKPDGSWRQNFAFGYLVLDGDYIKQYTKSDVLIFTIANSCISQPQNPSCEAISDNQIDISWTGGPETAITYEVFRNGFYLASTSLTCYSDTGLSPNTEYKYEISALKNGRQSTVSEEVVVTTDNTPNTPEGGGDTVFSYYYPDFDDDGHGDKDGTPFYSSYAPNGYKHSSALISINGDCDDNNPQANPGAMEVCDGVDNDCDGQVDEGFETVCDFDIFLPL